jgi:hypothetical protein
MLKGVGLMNKYMAGLSTNSVHPLTLDWGSVILLSALAKWLRKGAKVEKIGTIAHARRIGNEGFDRVIIDSGVSIIMSTCEPLHRYVNLKGFY